MTRKFTFLMTAMALIFAIMGPCSVAWGQESATMQYTGSTTTNMGEGNNATSVNLDATHWSVTADKGGNNNYPGLNKAGQIRLYGAATNHNVITVTNSDDATITTIVVTYGSSNYNAKVTVGGNEVTGTGSTDTEKTYSINNSSFSIAHNYSTTTQVYILSIVINYSTGSTSYTVTYDANGSTSGTVPVDENEYQEGDEVTVLGNSGDLAKTNYFFDGWNTQADGEGTTYQEGDKFNITASTTLHAKWTASQQQYPVTYKANGGTGEDIVEQYFENETVTIASCTFSNPGHNFTDWNTAADGTGTSYAVGATYTMTAAGLTLYAQWEEVTSASYVFNTDAGLAALGITKPSSSAGTNLGTKSYISGNISMNATDGSTPTRVWNSSGSTDLRIYNGGSLSFSIAGGNIVKIELTGNTTDVFSCGETGTFTNGTWTGSAPSVTLTATATGKINTIEVTYISAPQTKVTTPVITPNGGNIYGSQSVAISCTTDGATILYSTNNGTNWNTYNESFDLIGGSGTTTLKAKATLTGMEDSDEVSAIFIFAQTYTTVASVNALTEDNIPVIVSMDNWTIESINGNSMYVNDGANSLQIYDNDIPETYAVGGKLSGPLKAVWTTAYDGEVKTVQNWSEINYSAPTFAIVIDDEIENGTIEATPTTAPADTEISFSVTPNEGYRMVANSLIVLDATGDDVDFTGDNPYTFTMPASDVTISAEFELIPTTQYTYSYSINGIIGQELSVPAGTEITLADGSDLNTEFSFAGWTTDASDVEHILAVGSDYTIHDDVIFYAVYAKEEQGYEENVVIVDGSTLNSTATTTETTQVIDGVSYIFSPGAKKQAIQTEAVNYFKDGNAVLIGKSGAYIYNDNPFGNGITKFEIYANKGASAKVSVGVYFSANEITEYATGANTWTATLETLDNVYDASGKLPERAKYFWYQVTNANNSQIQFRITYLDQTISHNYYTRVFLNETATANINIGGPSIIPADSTLDMCTFTLGNTNAANLVIEDGGQLIHHNAGVVATVQKNITAYANEEVNDGYYLIANPTESVQNDEYDVLDGATSGFDLYTFDPTEESEWRNKVGTVSRIPFERTVGYLFAVPNDRTMSFRGSILPAGTMDIDLVYAEEGDGIDFPGFNLLGNPYACNAYVNKPALRLDDTGSEFIAVVGAINPCEGFFVEARSDDRTVTISTEEPGTAPSSLSLTVSQNRGQAIDRAIVSFNGNNDLHKFMLNPAHTNISLAKGGEEFAALSSEAEGEIPVSFKAEKNGSYTITVNTENVKAEYLHLIDNMTGMDTDLLSTPSYTFEAKTSDYASRFKLVFSMTEVEENASTSSVDFAYISNGNLVIDNIEGEATLQIVDEIGRIISTETVSGSYNKALNLKAGLYILNLNGMTQKIVVK